MPSSTIDDIKFAQTQIRNFALAQHECLQELEIETLPGVVLGHRNVPVNSVGCYIPGGRYPMVASAHMSAWSLRRRRASNASSSCAPPFGGKPHPAIVTAMHLGGADEIYAPSAACVQAIGAMAHWGPRRSVQST